MFIIESEAEHVVERSRFIAHILKVESIARFDLFLNEERKKYYDASHHCYAYIIGDNKKASDDGEPSMSAGIPILGVLEAHGLNECACIVTRYFGGIKLGVGGLARAYREATKKAVDRADFYEYQKIPRYKISLSYELSPQFENYLYAHKIAIEDIKYEEKGATYIFLDEFDHRQELSNITKGQHMEVLSAKIIAKKVSK